MFLFLCICDKAASLEHNKRTKITPPCIDSKTKIYTENALKILADGTNRSN